MIRINLLGEKIDKTGIYALQLLVVGCVIFVVCLGCFLFHQSKRTALEVAQADKEALATRLERARERTKQVSGLEEKEKLLHEKLMIIAKLKAEKQGPVQVLDELTKSVPERAWLRSLKQKEDKLIFVGVALDNQTVSDFMVGLNKSLFFGKASLVYTLEDTYGDVSVKQFSLSVPVKSLLEVTQEKAKAAASAEKEKEGETGVSSSSENEGPAAGELLSKPDESAPPEIPGRDEEQEGSE